MSTPNRPKRPFRLLWTLSLGRLPRWGKRSPPPGRRRGLCTPFPGRYLPLALSSLISRPCGTLLAVPRITWYFLFCIFSRYFSPTHRALHWPPLSPATPSHHSPPAASSREGGRRSIPVLRRRLVLSDASPSGWRRPTLSSEGFNRGPLPCQCRDKAVSHTPPPESNPNPCCWTPSAHGVCGHCGVLLRGDDAPLPDPTCCHPLPSSRTISRTCSLFSPGLGASRGSVALPPLLARQNHSGKPCI